MTSPLVGPINERADRHLFLGVLGAGLFWGFVADRAMKRIRSPRLRPLALVIALSPLAAVAQLATRPWRSDLTLWASAVERAPAAPRAWRGLSRARRLAGDLDGADVAAERALALDPESPTARLTRVYARIARGDLEGARQDLSEIEALGANPSGMQRARRCVALVQPAARQCIEAAPRRHTD